MSLTLHFHPLSSYCHKALIALYENDVPFERRIVNLMAPADAAAFKKLWPCGQFPVLQDEGRAIPEADPGQFTDLPLVVGEGADQAAPAVLTLLKPRGRLMDRLDAIVRVDDRRWDLRTKDGGLIELPADNASAALDQLDRLDQQSRILDLGFARIDLRDPDLVAVRPREAGPIAAPAANGA